MLQCVASVGFFLRGDFNNCTAQYPLVFGLFAAMTGATRQFFSIPFNPHSANRFRQRPTVFTPTPNCSAMAQLDSSFADCNIVRDGTTKRIGVVRRRRFFSSYNLSAADRVILVDAGIKYFYPVDFQSLITSPISLIQYIRYRERTILAKKRLANPSDEKIKAEDEPEKISISFLLVNRK